MANVFGSRLGTKKNWYAIQNMTNFDKTGKNINDEFDNKNKNITLDTFGFGSCAMAPKSRSKSLARAETQKKALKKAA